MGDFQESAEWDLNFSHFVFPGKRPMGLGLRNGMDFFPVPVMRFFETGKKPIPFRSPKSMGRFHGKK